MLIVTEETLRSADLDADRKQYHVAPGTLVTPLAREYLADRGIELVFGEQRSAMTSTPIEYRGNRTFIDAESGVGYAEKPERMTHLRANLLVPKTHPRIAFRGKLDSLQGEIIMAQCDACQEGYPAMTEDLGQLLDLSRRLLAAEVKELSLDPPCLLGYDESQLRRASHQVKEHFGIDHPTPGCQLGHLAARLNLLRTQVRETELAAEHAFAAGQRDDILLALNRMSSAVYIILCRLLAGQYGK